MSERESLIAAREALAQIVYETTKPNGVITNEWYREAVAVVRGIAQRALCDDERDRSDYEAFGG